MKNGIVDIGIFAMLDEIAQKHGIKDGQWAKRAGLGHGSRISELRRLSRAAAADRDDEQKKVGRAFSTAKAQALVVALKKLIGGDIVTKDLLALVDKAMTYQQKNMLMLLAANEEKHEQIFHILKALMQIPETKKDE